MASMRWHLVTIKFPVELDADIPPSVHSDNLAVVTSKAVVTALEELDDNRKHSSEWVKIDVDVQVMPRQYEPPVP